MGLGVQTATKTVFFAPGRWILHHMQTISCMIREERNENKTILDRSKKSKEGLMHDSKTVANRFLALARERGAALTPMQLQKLVYIAHGWTLGLYDRPLVRDEVQAWQYGPVIPRLYNATRHFRDLPVTGTLHAPFNDALSVTDDKLIRQVDDIYGKMSGPQLSRLTHAPGTPWHRTYRPGTFGIPIPNDIIQDHYKLLALERQQPT